MSKKKFITYIILIVIGAIGYALAAAFLNRPKGIMGGEIFLIFLPSLLYYFVSGVYRDLKEQVDKHSDEYIK